MSKTQDNIVLGILFAAFIGLVAAIPARERLNIRTLMITVFALFGLVAAFVVVNSLP